ncbi:hypothetical protein [Paraburkholderia fungorum]|uniref:hypothetical protein n=1 Tax=Paraburkholderia fungorum TaxID=134537 RepID=UPI0038BCDC46
MLDLSCWVNMTLNNSYYANELSINEQFDRDAGRCLEREVALWYGIHETLTANGRAFFVNRAILARQMNKTDTVESALQAVEKGLAQFFWNKIAAWPYHEEIDTEFGARAFHAGVNVTRSAPARAAVRRYLDASLGEYLISCASTHAFADEQVEFMIQEGDASIPVILQNFTARAQILADIGLTSIMPTRWKEALEVLSEKYPYVVFCDELKSKLETAAWNSNLYDQVDGKLARLNEIVGVAVRLEQARKAPDDEDVEKLATEYNRLYQDMFAHEDSPFSDESTTNKRKFRDELTFVCTKDGRTEFCPFHTKFSYKTFRLHFTWPLQPGDTQLYVVYLGRKITAS